MPYLKACTPTPEPIDCRILTAALDLFVDNGYHNVSIHEIQKRAQVSIGSIYNYFKGKEGVAEALYKHINREIEQLIDEVTSTITSPLAQCESIISQLFEHTETHKNIIAFAFHAKHIEFIPELPLVSDNAPFIKMRLIVEKGIHCGELNKINPWILTSLIFGSAIRMIQLRLDGQIEKPLTNYTAEFLQSLRQAVVKS
jgi:AcrR family transcriptional regulator